MYEFVQARFRHCTRNEIGREQMTNSPKRSTSNLKHRTNTKVCGWRKRHFPLAQYFVC